MIRTAIKIPAIIAIAVAISQPLHLAATQAGCGQKETPGTYVHTDACSGTGAQCHIYTGTGFNCSSGTKCQWCTMTNAEGGGCTDVVTGLSWPASCVNGTCTVTGGIAVGIPLVVPTPCSTGNDCEICRE